MNLLPTILFERLRQPGILFCVLAACPAAYGQGSLTPPGVPGPTMKTLTQVEPRTDVATLPGDSGDQYVISAPGSYYLSGNVNVAVASKNGIGITASNVVLDLNGFSVTRIGVASTQAGNGVSVTSGLSTVTVRNGIATGWNQGMGAVGVDHAHFEGVRANANATGFFVGTNGSTRNCEAGGNSLYGFVFDALADVVDCNASSNVSYGILTGDSSRLRGCVVSSSGFGIAANGSAVVADCHVNSCTSGGIVVSLGSSATGCTVRSGTGYGIYAGGASVTNCAVYGVANGFQLENGALLAESVADYCTTNGIYLIGNGCRVLNCDATANTGSGIFLAAGAANNRIEGNTVYNNAVGLTVNNAATNNLIIRNNARGNTSTYSLGTGTNDIAPVGTAATSTNPNTNFQ